MKKRLFAILLIIVVLCMPFVYRFSKYYKIACEQYASTSLKGDITSKINRQIMAYLNNSELNYSSITKVNYDKEDKINSISVNTSILSATALEISEIIYNDLRHLKESYNFPLGNAFGLRSLSGKGPNLSISVVPLSAVNYRIESQLLSSGINQTLHRIFIVFESEISCLAPFYETNITIETTIIIAETLIVGEVPPVLLPFDE